MSNQEISEGRRKLRAYMNPGEEFLTNATPASEFGLEMFPLISMPEIGFMTAEGWVEDYLKTGKFVDVRMLAIAFDESGEEIPSMVAIVGILKS